MLFETFQLGQNLFVPPPILNAFIRFLSVNSNISNLVSFATHSNL